MKMLIPNGDDHDEDGQDEDGQDEDDACLMIDTLAYLSINRIAWQRIIE